MILPSDSLAGLQLNPKDCTVKKNGKKIPLRKKEFELLEFLLRHKNRVLNRMTLLQYVWNYGAQATTNTLEVHMANLRRKIDGDSEQKILQTVHGLGYRLCDAPETPQKSPADSTPTAISRPEDTLWPH